MPSMKNEKFFWADRKNRMEKARLDLMVKTFDRSKRAVALEINREKMSVHKTFTRVRRTSGFSDQGIAPRGDSDNGYKSSPNFRMGLRLSEQRLTEWRETEKQLEKFILQSEWEMAKAQGQIPKRPLYGNRRTKSESASSPRLTNGVSISSSSGFNLQSQSQIEDDVFSENGCETKPQVMRSESVIYLDAQDVEKKIFNDYQNMISSTPVPPTCMFKNKKLRSQSEGNIANAKKLSLRPHTAHTISTSKHSLSSRSKRPSTAYSKLQNCTTKPRQIKNGWTSETKSSDDQCANRLHTNTTLHTLCEQEHSDMEVFEESFELNEAEDFKSPWGQQASPRGQQASPRGQQAVVDGDKCNILFDKMSILERMKEEGSLTKHTVTILHDDLKESSSENDINMDNSDEQQSPDVPVQDLVDDNIEGPNLKVDKAELNEKNDIQNTIPNKVLAFENKATENNDHIDSAHRHRRISGSSVVPATTQHTPLTSRQRTTSTSSFVSGSDRDRSVRYSSLSDIYSIGSDGQRRPSKWREYVAADKAKIPDNNKKLVSVAAVVKCALAFSKHARKRALDNLVSEQSMDPQDLIREERLRRMHSRNNILSAISKQWTLKEENETIVEQDV